MSCAFRASAALIRAGRGIADNLAPSTPAQFAFIDDFQSKVLALIASLPSGTGVFSPTCLLHCLSGQPSYQDLWVNLPTSNWTMSRALTAWYFQDIPVQVVSPCQGWNCTAACGATSTGIPCNSGRFTRLDILSLPCLYQLAMLSARVL